MPPVVGLAWWFAGLALPQGAWLALLGYSAAQLLLLGRLAAQPRGAVLSPALSLLLDLVLALGLLLAAPVLPAGAIYPLYVLLALRALSVARRQPAAVAVPFMLGPLFLFVRLRAGLDQDSELADLAAQWAMLLCSLWFGVGAIWYAALQHQAAQVLRRDLDDARATAERRVAQLERTAHDLRQRMRQQHALEEGLRVITSSLSLDDVLGQIVDSTVQMLGVSRTSRVALSLEADGGRFAHRGYGCDDATCDGWAAPLARRTMHQGTPLIIGDVRRDSELAGHMPPEARSALSVPLFVGAEGPCGALTVVGTEHGCFSSSDARHLTAFAIQAGIAIGNAGLHSRLRQQQLLLESVVRDISDGLVVLNPRGEVVLSNPLGDALLGQPCEGETVRERLVGLCAGLQPAESGHGLLSAELRLGDNEDPLRPTQVFQALASRVRQTDSVEPLVAVVLHDVTAERNELRNRMDFFSMVAHELRNPLNSMYGFVKLLVQGRAGKLEPLQQEFLEIVDEQVERLKGRIAELLEFNRLEAGRLALRPEKGQLPALVESTVVRLQLQAEQAGLRVVNALDTELPELRFDSERIGQVLTNLIENAMKATPAGGEITIRSEQYPDEVWVRVYDTGVGIPVEEQGKIFQAFYRAHDRTSSKGNHLGLGLAICQQIVQGHGGRIWVESEVGSGSCFSFTLPVTEEEREREANG
ncbi:MAG TPA: ATP-binding protein [Roseiflexaceae bacterium]|nr:ATP-binding protein [Roseiflexaceae bacterium]